MRIYLRPIAEKDARLIVKWRNNPIVLKHCFNQKPITIESHLKFYHDFVETGLYRQYIVERVEETSGVASYPIATVYLKDIDRTNNRCELCIFTSDDEEWNTQSQSMAITQLLDIAFKELEMHKVYSYVFVQYEDEKQLLESAGFQVETIMKNEAKGADGQYDDAYRMSIFKEDYEKLGR